ncbi:hypothetical protein KBY66_04310 [Synechococcus sp. Tobar12-5m-g]|uniref:hypothetical protein n=1 Tax=unclassified Synechococcus TaxID=2626047 RepID=UPI0020CDBD28|nr:MULTISPECIES: hypothetical protein [unclassified Synechococcus]MCP9771851.1 hypothetical protein [Synechococcus sp. Tobar12-5m-g]MCP9872793.1 hypothetical protein [Synechococcus sp. Cruz CV-v-12]
MKARLLLLGLGLIALPAEGLAQNSCPLLVPRQESFLQPKRLPPSQVSRKNAAGCLSPADAIYGPDGCPRKLCPKPTRGIEL